MPMPTKNTAIVLRGSGTDAPQLLFQKLPVASGHFKILLLAKEMSDWRQPAPGVPRSLKQGLFQSRPFKNHFWRKTDRDR
jgi:hypothetical protein